MLTMNATFRAVPQNPASHFRRRLLVLLLVSTTHLVSCSQTATSDPQKPPYVVVVAEDGARYAQGVYHDRLIRVPYGRPGEPDVASVGILRWAVQLPASVRPARPRERERGESTGIVLQITPVVPDPSIGNPPEDPFLTMLARSPSIDYPPTQTFPEWGLALYHDPKHPDVRPGGGLFVPLDPAFRSPDGQRPVIDCASRYVEVDPFPDSLSCETRGVVSDRLVAKMSFRGNALPTWRIVHDLAWASVSQNVLPLEKQ